MRLNRRDQSPPTPAIGHIGKQSDHRQHISGLRNAMTMGAGIVGRWEQRVEAHIRNCARCHVISLIQRNFTYVNWLSLLVDIRLYQGPEITRHQGCKNIWRRKRTNPVKHVYLHATCRRPARFWSRMDFTWQSDSSFKQHANTDSAAKFSG